MGEIEDYEEFLAELGIRTFSISLSARARAFAEMG
jgi:hypothetical protein